MRAYDFCVSVRAYLRCALLTKRTLHLHPASVLLYVARSVLPDVACLSHMTQTYRTMLCYCDFVCLSVKGHGSQSRVGIIIVSRHAVCSFLLAMRNLDAASVAYRRSQTKILDSWWFLLNGLDLQGVASYKYHAVLFSRQICVQRKR